MPPRARRPTSSPPGGPDVRAWHSDATKERIRFSSGLIQNTMRWTNRSTFQQVLEFVNPVAAARTPRHHRAAAARL